MKKFIYIFLIFIFYVCNSFSAFEEDNNSVRASSLGGAMTSLYDDVSVIFFNPASIGLIPTDSSIKLDVQYANKYGIEGYNLYSGNLVFTKFKIFGLRPGFSFIREGVSDIISETRFKIGFSKPKNDLSVNGLSFNIGTSINYYKISASGEQLDSGDNALTSKSAIGFDFGVLFMKNNFSFGFAIKNIMLGENFGNSIRSRFGISYIIPQHSSILSMDFEPIKGIKGYDREWVKIGSLKIGKGFYPMFNFGFEKVVKRILIFRVGLKDFKINLGLGVKFKNITAEYSFTTEEVGNTHRIGIKL
jgi:hypothetical protein